MTNVCISVPQTPAPEGVDCNFRPLLPEWRPYCRDLDKARRMAGTLQVMPTPFNLSISSFFDW